MKKILIILSVGAIAFLSWYLFLKKGEFNVHFEVDTLPGDVKQTFLLWNRSLPATEVKLLDSNSISQDFQFQNTTYQLLWSLKEVGDSKTKVNVTFSQPGNEIKNKILVPFIKPQIEVDAESIVKTFYAVLKEHLNRTAVEVNGISSIESKFCICTSLETTQIEKANGMQQVYGNLVGFVNQNNLIADGRPILDVKSLDLLTGELLYDFCFPIKKHADLPGGTDMLYKEIKSALAIKATYNGNYITSDRAWYYIIQYSKRNNLVLKDFPIEVFHTNPNTGLKEKEWKAEIFWPIE